LAKRKKHGKLSGLLTIVVIEVFFFVVIRNATWPYPIFLTLIAISIPLGWWSFFMPTYCDYLTITTRTPCTNPVNGKLRGCKRHRRQKNDQVFAMINMSNPGQAFRLAWGAAHVLATATVGAGRSVEVSRKNAYDAIMLVSTVGSLFVGAAGAVFTALTLE
jgi:hypothetical protein